MFYLIQKRSWSTFITAFLLLFLWGLPGCKRTPSSAYTFFVAGHTYGHPARKAPGLHPPFVEDFAFLQKQEGLACGVFTGDIVYYSRDTFWDQVDREIADLEVPVHFAVGNHDEGARSPFKERYGPTYYHFEQNGDLFLILNPGLKGWNIADEQLAFLRKQLSRANRYHNIFLFFHQLLWWTPDNGYRKWAPNTTVGRVPNINFWPEIMPMLYEVDRPVYCFAGDIGGNLTKVGLFADHEKNVHLLASGMGNLRDDNYLIVEVGMDKQVQIKVRWLQKKTLQSIDWKNISLSP
ncbi:MAG: hypothetical protein AAF985_14010 [Bacteroidota bacterium]